MDRRGFLGVGAGIGAALVGALAMPGSGEAAQEIAKGVPYADALKSITDKLDKEIKVDSFTVKLSSSRLTNSQLDALAVGLITGVESPKYISGMPTKFSERRIRSMTESQRSHGIPYINHESAPHDLYSVKDRASETSIKITEAAKANKLSVLGLTPLDHQNALYAIAVQGADRRTSWIVAQITEGHSKLEANGSGPAHGEIHKVLPKIITEGGR